jgi:hypothetical protein
MTPAEVSPLLSATSILLAAFGFLYASWRDEITSALEPQSFEELSRLEARTRAVKAVRNTKAIPLALASTLVAALFLPPSVTMVRDALGNGEGYDALRAAFVLMESFWIFVAVSRLWLVWKFGRTLSDLKENLSRLRQGSS